jgi:penicillin-binding protein 2
VTFWVQRAEVGEFRRRYRWLVLFVLTTFLVFIGRLAQLQLLEGGLHRAEALRNIVGERRLATTRGVIRDAHGKVLAANRPSYNVHVVPQYIDMDKTWPEVVKLMRLEPDEAAELKQKILDARAKGEKRAKQQTQLKGDVDRNVVAALETHAAELRGIDVVPVPVRYYPYGTLAAHMLGYMREVDADTLARLQDTDYRAGDRLGAVGVERRWREMPRNVPGNVSRARTQ